MTIKKKFLFGCKCVFEHKGKSPSSLLKYHVGLFEWTLGKAV